MDKPNPSLIRIIQSDYIAMVGVFAPAVFLAAYIAVAYFGFLPGFRGHDPIQGMEGAPFFLYGFIVTLVLGIPAVIWRFKTIQNVFANGTEVVGRIEDIHFRRDRGNVLYRYEYQGKTYAGTNDIMKNARTQSLAPAKEIVLIVSRDEIPPVLLSAICISDMERASYDARDFLRLLVAHPIHDRQRN